VESILLSNNLWLVDKMLEVITYSNKDNSGLNNLICCLDRLHYSYTVLGKGETWVNFMTKINSCLNYISTLAPDKLVVVCDAFDVLVQSPPEELIARYKSFNSPLVVGTELMCSPSKCYKLVKYWKDKKKPNENIHPNGGFYMGPAKVLVPMFRYMLSLDISDDQVALGKYIEEHPQHVKLDCEALLVATINSLTIKPIEPGKKIRYRVTGSEPCFFHTVVKKVNLHNYNNIGRRLLGEDFQEPNISPLIKGWFNIASLVL